MDAELKYGLCVTGIVHPDRILTKGATREGDVLFLTKPIGTGVIATALKKERVEGAHVDAAVASMLRLSARRRASWPAFRRCAPVPTSPALASWGTATEMALASGLALEIEGKPCRSCPAPWNTWRPDLLPSGADRTRPTWRPRTPPAPPSHHRERRFPGTARPLRPPDQRRLPVFLPAGHRQADRRGLRGGRGATVAYRALRRRARRPRRLDALRRLPAPGAYTGPLPAAPPPSGTRRALPLVAHPPLQGGVGGELQGSMDGRQADCP